MGSIKKSNKDVFSLSDEEDELSDANSNFSIHETDSEFSLSSEDAEEMQISVKKNCRNF